MALPAKSTSAGFLKSSSRPRRFGALTPRPGAANGFSHRGHAPPNPEKRTMPEYFRKPLSEEQQSAPAATYASPNDEAKLERKRRQLDAIFAKRTLTSEDLHRFTLISGMALASSEMPTDGAALAEMLRSGQLIRARIAVD